MMMVVPAFDEDAAIWAHPSQPRQHGQNDPQSPP
jgi:hypothetical protein